MTRCNHSISTTVRTDPFFGPVHDPKLGTENRAAHGCVTDLDECTDCGAQRWVNRNGVHTEYGPWSPSRPERQAAAAEASKRRAAAFATAPTPVNMLYRGIVVEVQLDSDGFIAVSSTRALSQKEQDTVAAILPIAWIAAACRCRQAVLDEALTHASVGSRPR